MSLGWFQKKSTPPPPPPPEPMPQEKASSPAAGSAKPSKGKAKSSPVSELLSEDVILVAQPGQDKGALLEGLVTALCAKHGFSNKDALLAKVVDREKSVSTTLDTGLSLPHARLESISRIVAGMALVPQGIADPQLVIRVMFLFFSPDKQEFIQPHLRMLREVSFFFQPDLVEQLSQAATPAAALELIRRKEA